MKWLTRKERRVAAMAAAAAVGLLLLALAPPDARHVLLGLLVRLLGAL